MIEGDREGIAEALVSAGDPHSAAMMAGKRFATDWLRRLAAKLAADVPPDLAHLSATATSTLLLAAEQLDKIDLQVQVMTRVGRAAPEPRKPATAPRRGQKGKKAAHTTARKRSGR